MRESRCLTRNFFLQEIKILSWVNIGNPPPQQWIETYEVLLSSLRRFIALMPPGSDAHGRAELVLKDDITLDFFIAMISRFHINTFR